MKKYKYIIMMLTGLVIWLPSCNDDFLERAPLLNLSDANFWKSENDLKVYVNNFYNQDGLLTRYQGEWFSQGRYGSDADGGSDTYIPIDYNRRMNGENTLPASGGGWSSGDWGLLRDINYFMDHYQAVAAPWENIRPYVGETLFFRAIFYFRKLRTFGDVPWSSTTVNMDSETLFAPRMPRSQVTDSILHDLD
ncbi:MAG: RagB/SusD family nutrient uptake outer membrane protein, partial [Tannerella sp.]|nr:RagB/SusD family nutrient uptake outer membrane protein [Tannerella sp.]